MFNSNFFSPRMIFKRRCDFSEFGMITQKIQPFINIVKDDETFSFIGLNLVYFLATPLRKSDMLKKISTGKLFPRMNCFMCPDRYKPI